MHELRRLLDLPLVFGVLPTAISAAGIAAMVFLLARRGRHWWLRTVPVAVLAGLAGVGMVEVVLWVWRPFPDDLPPRMLAWIAFALCGVALAVVSLRSPRWRQLLVIPALVLVLATSAVKANAFYGYRPTLAGALDLPASDEIDFSDVPATEPSIAATARKPLWRAWRPPPELPSEGRITHVDIAGTESGFAARPAWIYLPPAYLAARRPLLPVLTLVAGQPGGPEDWMIAGRLADVMDGFAAHHGGLAPVVVVPDATGSEVANPLCMDSRLGAVETYLGTDVPAWIAEHLQVDPDPRHRAIGGFSYGGTCALQLAVRRPTTYPTFLDVSGDLEPTLGSAQETIDATFGGDAVQFHAADPADILATIRFPNSAGAFVAGQNDPDGPDLVQRATAAAAGAGMNVHQELLPGGHTWVLADDALATELPWLATEMGLAPPPPPPTP